MPSSTIGNRTPSSGRVHALLYHWGIEPLALAMLMPCSTSENRTHNPGSLMHSNKRALPVGIKPLTLAVLMPCFGQVAKVA